MTPEDHQIAKHDKDIAQKTMFWLMDRLEAELVPYAKQVEAEIAGKADKAHHYKTAILSVANGSETIAKAFSVALLHAKADRSNLIVGWNMVCDTGLSSQRIKL
jgi:hypothetical protein